MSAEFPRCQECGARESRKRAKYWKFCSPCSMKRRLAGQRRRRALVPLTEEQRIKKIKREIKRRGTRREYLAKYYAEHGYPSTRNARWVQLGREAIWIAHCAECNSPMLLRQYRFPSTERFCSYVCRKEFEFKNIRTARKCKFCGSEFEPRTRLARFCTDICEREYRAESKREARRSRKYRERSRGIRYDRASRGPSLSSIWRKFQGHCIYCGIAVDRQLGERSQPNTATVDHVLPLARGGEHTDANVVLACHRCNSAKSDAEGHFVTRANSDRIWGGFSNDRGVSR